MKILVTGGTVFVSKYVARYFVEKGADVYVLNRNTRPQVEGVKLVEADRHELKDLLKDMSFDAVLDITAYDAQDITDLVKALKDIKTYIMLSSSAVYPEDEAMPFVEETPRRENKYWKRYGTDKIAAEDKLLELVPDAYILRPPYLYGPMDNLYREAFVFDCAKGKRQFFLPNEGQMKLQFFHVRDLCRMIENIIDLKPSEHIFNVGNPEAVTVKEWVELCYECVGTKPEFINVYEPIEQRNYFSFYGYEYMLDVSKQMKILDGVTDLKEGLKEALAWYNEHASEVRKKPLLEFIDNNMRK